MRKNVYKYFEDLHQQDLVMKKDYLIVDGEKIPNKIISNAPFGNDILYIGGKKFFAKDTRSISDCQLLPPTELGSTKMYNDLGILTPPAFVIENPRTQRVYLTTQDVNSLEDYTAVLASKSQIEQVAKLHYLDSNEIMIPWYWLSDKALKSKLLSFMTPECYDELVSVCLLDEVRTECDRLPRNFFLIKHKDAKRFENVVPIDNEFAEVAYSNASSKSDFDDIFVNYQYYSATPLGSYVIGSFAERMDHIKKLLHDGKLTPAQISLITKELKYDLPKAIKNGSKHPQLEQCCQEASDCMSLIWDYHYSKDGLARELGL